MYSSPVLRLRDTHGLIINTLLVVATRHDYKCAYCVSSVTVSMIAAEHRYARGAFHSQSSAGAKL